jgi:apolipoprotein N-acyltransferase
MFKRTITSTRNTDRLSYLWLAIAAALFVFAGIQWVIPLAAWLAPLFLLRFVRTQRLLPGFLLAWLVRFAVAAVVLQGIILYPGFVYYPLVLILTLVTMLPYLADRLLAPRLGGFVATLVFPLAYTLFEYSALSVLWGLLPRLRIPSMVTCHSCKWCR